VFRETGESGARSLLFVRAVPIMVALPVLRWLREQAPGTKTTVLTSGAGVAPSRGCRPDIAGAQERYLSRCGFVAVAR
jgi:hypothetical protein